MKSDELNQDLLQDALAGLRQQPRSLHCKYFYDAEGSRLFEAITQTEDYYPTRTEISILRSASDDIRGTVGPSRRVIEFGSGSGVKTELLLELLETPISYTPVEISAAALEASTTKLRDRFPEIAIEPMLADYTAPFDLEIPPDDRIVFFPGSTIGNFERDEARAFLSQCAALVGSGGGLLIGADLKKDPSVLHRAYNDSEGVTEAFNLNLLSRLNREVGADFDLDAWRHYAYYAPIPGRIEVYLVSLADQDVTIQNETFSFGTGEAIHTEYSHKYGVSEFREIGEEAGFEHVETWTDPRRWFGLFYFVAK